MNRVETAEEEVFLCDKFEQKVQFHRAAMFLPRFSPRGQKIHLVPLLLLPLLSLCFVLFSFCHLLTLPARCTKRGGNRGASRVFAGCHAGSLSKVGSVVF